MSIVQALTGSILAGQSAGGGGGTQPTGTQYRVTWDTLTSTGVWRSYVDEVLYANNGGINGDIAPIVSNLAYPDSSFGPVFNFVGGRSFRSPQLYNFNGDVSFTINMWFYANGVNQQLISERGPLGFADGYHYSMLEIHSDSTVKARTWPNSPVNAITSIDTITDNAWNHVYLTQDSGGAMVLIVNNGSGVGTTLTPRSPPGTLSTFCFGGSDATYIVNTGAFQGLIGHVQFTNIASAASTFAALKTRYGIV